MPRPWIPRIQLHHEFWNKPQLREIGNRVGLDRLAVAGRVVLIWATAQEKANGEGVLAGKFPAWVDTFVECAGFATAMMEAGWLDLTPAGVKIPEFDAFISKRAIRRLSKAEWQQANRTGKLATAEPNVDRCGPNVDPTGTLPPATTVSGPTRKEVAARFERFWTAFPNKKGKPAALGKFRVLDPSEELLVRILAAIELQSRSQQWVKDDGQFIPNPATWLHNKRWEDDPAAYLPAGGGAVQSGGRIQPKPGQFRTTRNLTPQEEAPPPDEPQAGGGTLF